MTDDPPLTVRYARDGDGARRISVGGELDLASAARLRAHVRDFLEPGATLVLDLSRVDFVDSAGVAALLELRAAADGVGATLALCAPSPAAVRTIELLGLQEALGIA